MDRISGLSDELLVKILSFPPTKIVVSTSVLSKRWESLWLWVPKLHFVTDDKSFLPIRDFINKNLPLLKTPVIESLRLRCFSSSQPEDIKKWVGISVSRCIRELNIFYLNNKDLLLPSSLYTCNSLVTLKLNGFSIIVDVPRTVLLPCLKTLVLGLVTFTNEDSLRLLLSYCPVLEDLDLCRKRNDNVKTVVVVIPSLLRLALPIYSGFLRDGYVIVTPSLKCFKAEDFCTESYSYLIAHMPQVEIADFAVEGNVEKLFESIISVKRLSLSIYQIIKDEFIHRNGIVFNQLEYLKLRINRDYWSKLLIRLLQDSPKLRVLKIFLDTNPRFGKYESASWNNDDESSVPKCLLESLETFEFAGYSGRQEERDVVSYVLKNARHLKSSSISHVPCYNSE